MKYPCGQCEYQATRKDNLDQHKRSVHKGIKKYTFYFLLAMVNGIDIVNMSNIYDKGRKYDNCGTCKMENTENL